MRVTLLLTLFLVLLGPKYASADVVQPLNFMLFATHPDAVAQPTAIGQTISDIKYYEGQLYTGYGDWYADHGPIAIRALDADSAQWSSSLLTLQTEAISHFRGLNGSLYTTTVDPLNINPPGTATQPAGFAIGDASHNWTAINPTIVGTGNPLTAFHVFDINRSSNGDLWMTGSLGNDGMVWRSADGGATFSIAQQTPPPAGSDSFAFSRYVGAAVFDDRLYVQRVDYNVASPNSESLVFDGNSWSTGPDLISGADGFMAKPDQFGNQLVYLSDDHANGFLYHFDGINSQHALPGVVHDFQIAGDFLIALASGGELLYTKDLLSWESAGFVPGDARSIELVGDTLFVGTTGSQIFYASGLTAFTAVPEPSSFGAVSILATSILSMRRRRMR